MKDEPALSVRPDRGLNPWPVVVKSVLIRVIRGGFGSGDLHCQAHEK
ncbi:MAG TPA: hypothetical protein VML55_08070 [Planctomycetaceae bacterium]|nr:hypothetical protein [Planctomycetaceae bacterium]